MELAYVGIDVACAKTKRLPINVSVMRDGYLMPLPLRLIEEAPPRGAGNVMAIDDAWRGRFAEDTVAYLKRVEAQFAVKIDRVAVDAPSHPRGAHLNRRDAESALDARGISCITTPSASAFETIAAQVRAHVAGGASETRVPHANQIWMLVGFALFDRLCCEWPCIEVYPQATVALLGCGALHKSKPEGLVAQLQAIRDRTGWAGLLDPVQLRATGFGAAHDLMDAYLAAWVASLPENTREPLGTPPDDVIWVPALAHTPFEPAVGSHSPGAIARRGRSSHKR